MLPEVENRPVITPSTPSVYDAYSVVPDRTISHISTNTRVGRYFRSIKIVRKTVLNMRVGRCNRKIGSLPLEVLLNI